MLEIAVLYGCDLSQVFTPIILRLYQPHSLCEKGATRAAAKAALYVFLLAPLHEGRREPDALQQDHDGHFYSRPYTRGDQANFTGKCINFLFLLPPLHEGRREQMGKARPLARDFYSRPYTRGDSPPRQFSAWACPISTRAPTRGATAIFHKTIS